MYPHRRDKRMAKPLRVGVMDLDIMGNNSGSAVQHHGQRVANHTLYFREFAWTDKTSGWGQVFAGRRCFQIA